MTRIDDLDEPYDDREPEPPEPAEAPVTRIPEGWEPSEPPF